MDYPLISVIIPVYNTQQYLDRCLGSVLNNTYNNLEVICIDDGSTDESLIVLNQWAEKDTRVKILEGQHKGISSTRNVGIRSAKGDLIGFVDSDDWVHKQYFELLFKIINDYGVDIAVCERTVTGEHSVEESNIEIRDVQIINANSFTKNKYVKTYIWGRLYKKSLVSEFDTALTFVEDRAFNFNVMFNNPNAEIGYTKTSAYYYFSRDTSVVHTVSKEEWYRITDYYVKKLKEYVNAGNTYGIKLYFEDAIKFTLSFRYMIGNDYSWEKESKRLGRKAMLLLQEVGGAVSTRKKACYYIFLRFPISYKLFRYVVEIRAIHRKKSAKQK